MTEHQHFMKERFKIIRDLVSRTGPIKAPEIQKKLRLGKRAVTNAVGLMVGYGLLMKIPDFKDLRSHYYDLPNIESESEADKFIESIIEV